MYVTSIIMMLIAIVLMVEDRCSISSAKDACYEHNHFIICDENGCKTNSFLYFKTYFCFSHCRSELFPSHLFVV